jgi:hypothetical protein
MRFRWGEKAKDKEGKLRKKVREREDRFIIATGGSTEKNSPQGGEVNSPPWVCQYVSRDLADNRYRLVLQSSTLGPVFLADRVY